MTRGRMLSKVKGMVNVLEVHEGKLWSSTRRPRGSQAMEVRVVEDTQHAPTESRRTCGTPRKDKSAMFLLDLRQSVSLYIDFSSITYSTSPPLSQALP